MFNTNTIPQDMEKTNAYFRRFIFIIFDQVISKKEKNDNLAKEIIEEEMSGVFNWVLEGLDRFMKNKGFTESKHINDAMVEIMRDTDTVREFMNEMGYEPDITQLEHQEKKVLFAQYIDFCEKGKYKAVSTKEFTRRLGECGYAVEKGKTNNQTWVYCKNGSEDEERKTEDLIEKVMMKKI